MTAEVNIPDFFIPGVPKSGTTSLNYYLSQHPKINMLPKELHYFGKDLPYLIERTSIQKYNKYFSKNPSIINGDASIWYLYSKNFAKEIKALNPNAKFIILLRNPVEMIYSLHSQNLYDANESETDFKKALSLEKDRKNGQNIPHTCSIPLSLYYKEVGLYYSIIKRLLDEFPKEQILIATFDEFIASENDFVQRVFKFLNLDPFHNIDFSRINEGKNIKNLTLHQNLKAPSNFKKRVFRTIIPFKPLRKRIIHSLYNRNIEKSKKDKIDSSLRDQLETFFRADLLELEKITGLKINNWL